VSDRIGDGCTPRELAQRLQFPGVIIKNLHPPLGREKRRHGCAVTPIVSADIVGENLLNGQFVRHRKSPFESNSYKQLLPEHITRS
jgi:hypothetical protein